MATARLDRAARFDRDRVVVGAFGTLVAIPLLLFVAPGGTCAGAFL